MTQDDLIDDNFEIDEASIEPDFQPTPQARVPTPPQSQTVADGQRLEQRRFTGGDTLDEPVWTTIFRDVKSFGRLLLQTVGWKQEEIAGKREWDLWGPLIFCLVISLVLGLKAATKSETFSLVFTLIWLGQALITSNVKLLGGKISYLHALSITGYSLFPLLLAASFTSIIHMKLIRIPINVLLVAWAIWSARRGLGFAGVSSSRIALAAYPLGLFYTSLGWLCVLA